MIGNPRQVRNWEPKSEMVGGGTPRECIRARTRRWPQGRQEESRFFPYPGNQFIHVVRRRRADTSLYLHVVIDVSEQAILLVVKKLPLLTLLDDFNGRTNLFVNLVVRAAVQVETRV